MPIVAKNPAVMTDHSYTAELEWDGDDAFWDTHDIGEWKNRRRFVRAEN
jgi:hypothetical protein